MRDHDFVIARVEPAVRMLQAATTPRAAKKVADIAKAAEVYAKRQKLGKEAQLSAHQIVIDAETLLGAFLAAAEKNQGARGVGKSGVPPENPTLGSLGISKKESSNGQFLAELRVERPEAHMAIRNGEATITEVRRATTKANILKKVATLPRGKFRVFYADPPWKYGDTRALDCWQSSAAEDHYPTMSIAQLCALPISDISHGDAVLFLWVTSPFLFECAPVIKAWGFDYRACFVWDKVRHNVGHYNSVRHEFLLICVRGSCTPDVNKLFDSVQSIERTGKHSEKPEEFRKIIDTLYPTGPRIELFARAKSKNWASYGNEC